MDWTKASCSSRSRTWRTTCRRRWSAGAPYGSGGAEVLVAQPAFEPYLHGAHSLGARVVSVPPGKDFAFPLDAMLRAITPNTRLVYVNNPNNPSGQPIPKEAIHRIAREAAHALVFVDEAYHDFLGENFLAEAAAYPNVLIGRTFSKAFGLAGMRVGVMIASPEILAPIRKCMPLFNLNVVAVAALRAAIGDPSFRTWYLAQANESKAARLCRVRARRPQLLEERREFRVDRRRRAGAPDHRRHDRERRVRPRSDEGSGEPTCFRLTTGVVEHTRKATETLEALCARLR